MINFWKIKEGRFLYNNYFFVDCDKYLFENLFYEDGIRAKVTHQLVNEENSFRLIICRIKKKDENRFANIMGKLANKMMLCGYPNYADECEYVQSKIGAELVERGLTQVATN